MDLCDIREIKALLARHGFRFSKSMGQNFLIADWVPRDIAEAAGLDESCAVLEIGPGKALSGFVKKTVPGFPVYAAETAADVEALERLVKENG